MFVITYETESGDAGVVLSHKEPAEEQLIAFFQKRFPDEFYDGGSYMFWTVNPAVIADFDDAEMSDV